MKLVLTSGHRVGSRWIVYLLKDALGVETHPEMGGKWLTTPQNKEKVASLIKQNKLVKFHGVMPSRIYKAFPNRDLKVLVIVRNPRDRAVSYAFHNRYHDKTSFKQKYLDNDLQAVDYTVYKDKLFKSESSQQVRVMVPELSTRNYQGGKNDYVWTCYEWLKEDIFGEMNKVLELAEINISKDKLTRAIHDNSFKAKSSRKVGEEDRKDIWRRKGINGDWENWFDSKMIEYTQKEYDKYFEVLSLSDKEK